MNSNAFNEVEHFNAWSPSVRNLMGSQFIYRARQIRAHGVRIIQNRHEAPRVTKLSSFCKWRELHLRCVMNARNSPF